VRTTDPRSPRDGLEPEPKVDEWRWKRRAPRHRNAAGECRGPGLRASIRLDRAHRPLVADPGAPGARAPDPHRLRQLRGVPGSRPLPLHRRGPRLPLAVLLALRAPGLAPRLALAG